MGLAIHLAQPAAPKPDESAFVASPDGRALITGSSEGWGTGGGRRGYRLRRTRAAARRTTAFYTGASAEAG